MRQTIVNVLIGLALFFCTMVNGWGQSSSTGIAAPNTVLSSNVAATVVVEPTQVAMGDWLKVTVTNPSGALVNAVNNRSKIVLFLGGFPLKGLNPISCIISNNSAQFQFHLEWTAASCTNWVALLRKPHFGSLPFAVGVGLEDSSILATSGDNQELTFYALPNWEVILWGLFLLLFLFCFAWMCVNSELLRDAGPDPGSGHLRSFSLARVQMAVWFFLAITAFIFLRVITGGAEVLITNTVLTLIGIGTGTALGAAVQDANKFAQLRQERADLQSKLAQKADPEQQRRLEEISILLADRGALEQEQKQLEGLAARTPDQQNRLDTVKKLLVQALPVRISHGFFEDILTDDVGISFHRVQMFVWTVVLAVFFISDVINNLAMPEFGNTLLALMGISSGTYLGFMLTEPHSSEAVQN